MLTLNIKQMIRRGWNWWNVVVRHDVLVESSVTIKYWRSLRFGKKCTVQSAAYIYGSRNSNPVCFGNSTVISHGCMLLGEGGLSVGDFTHLGPAVVVTTQYGDSASDQCSENPIVKYSPVKIGKGCWIGAGSVIMPGTVLGDRCIVAPNSVVYGVWKDNAKLAGNPARNMAPKTPAA